MTYAAQVHKYARDAAKNKGGKFCKWLQLAGQRHLDDRKKKKFPYVFVDWYANDICEFIERLPHIRGEWKSKTITLEPWQIFLLGSVFGWRYRKDQTRRRFSSAYVEIGRKNSKSTMAAAIALYCLAYDNEPGPQILIGATTQKQADHVFIPAKAMTEKLPAFRSANDIQVSAEKVFCKQNFGTIERLTASASHELGWNPHLVILDELAVHADEELFKVCRSAFGARRNPLLLMITTAGPDLEGIAYQQRNTATSILQGEVDMEHFFAAIYTLDEGDSEFDPKVWIKANPNLGVSCSVDELAQLAEEAKRSNTLREELAMRRLNMWLEARSGWINMGLWNECAGVVDPDAMPNAIWTAGLDLAATSDFAAFVMATIHDDKLKLYAKMYISEQGARQRSLKNVPVDQWAEQGYVTITPGEVTDYQYIENDIEALDKKHRIADIAADQWNAWNLIQRLEEKGIRVRTFRQGPQSYHPVMTDFERHIKAGTLVHPTNPCLSWMAGNIIARTDLNMNMAPDRKRSADKIDGIAAALMATSGCMQSRTQVYPVDENEFLVRLG